MSKKTLFNHKHDELCPKCNGLLVIRSSSHGPFQGCSNYPECDYIRPLKEHVESHIIKELDGQHCPQCQGILVLKQGKYGMFIGCQNYPECSFIASTEQANNEGEHVPCPQCQQGNLKQKTSRFGKVFYACDRYPACQFSLNGAPVVQICEYCHYPLLIRKKSSTGEKLFCANKLCGKEQLIK